MIRRIELAYDGELAISVNRQTHGEFDFNESESSEAMTLRRIPPHVAEKW